MHKMLRAIVDDDTRAVAEMLRKEPGLAVQLIDKPQLYRSGIFHWIYIGDTALHLAAAGYRVDVARLLIQAGANPNAANSRRQAGPLHYAADGFITGPAWDEKRQVETIRLLLAKGANIQMQDKNGATPLHRAVRTRCAAAVRCLLDAGADPEAQNNSGSTSFHLAVQNTGRGGSGSAVAIHAQRDIIKTFLQLGLDPARVLGGGKSVSDWARSPWILEMLTRHEQG